MTARPSQTLMTTSISTMTTKTSAPTVLSQAPTSRLSSMSGWGRPTNRTGPTSFVPGSEQTFGFRRRPPRAHFWLFDSALTRHRPTSHSHSESPEDTCSGAARGKGVTGSERPSISCIHTAMTMGTPDASLASMRNDAVRRQFDLAVKHPVPRPSRRSNSIDSAMS